MLLDILRNKNNEIMKKSVLTLTAMIVFTTTIFGQAGINNASPKSTLDITGTTAATVADGVLVPRFTAAELTGKDNAYMSAQNGTLVFVTSGTGVAGTKTSAVTGSGFYYYDVTASKWLAVGGGSSSTAPFGITSEQTGNYTVVAGDNFIKLNINSPGYTLTLPTTGIPKGKIVYVSNIGTNGIDISPLPANTSYAQVFAQSSGALVYKGGTGPGSWDWVLGF